VVLVRKEKSRYVKNRGFKHYLSHVTVYIYTSENFVLLYKKLYLVY